MIALSNRTTTGLSIWEEPARSELTHVPNLSFVFAPGPVRPTKLRMSSICPSEYDSGYPCSVKLVLLIWNDDYADVQILGLSSDEPCPKNHCHQCDDQSRR
jgi:hypothetical protein